LLAFCILIFSSKFLGDTGGQGVPALLLLVDSGMAAAEACARVFAGTGKKTKSTDI
jgi:hypothetical protein